jgi:cell division protein ZapD
MSSNTIIYEQPLNELIRAALRFEYLFNQIDYCLINLSPSHCAKIIISYIINIINLFDRSDLKSKLTKEFHRHTITLSRLASTPGIDQQRLEKILNELKALSNYLLNVEGRIAQSIRDDPFIVNVHQYFNYPGDCYIDSALYHYWLSQPQDQLDQQLYDWLDTLAKPRAAIDMLLRLARQSNTSEQVEAEKGFYCKTLDASLPWQIIRIGLTDQQLVYPEVSAGKHRISIRFISHDRHQTIKQTEETVSFQLSCCTF